MKNKWVCEICAREFVKEVDLLAHQFNSSCEKQLREREQGMNDIICKCGHTINWHGSDGCHDTVEDDKTCKCQNTPQSIAEPLRARVAELEAALNQWQVKMVARPVSAAQPSVQPSMQRIGGTSCRWCDKSESEHIPTMRHKFTANH